MSGLQLIIAKKIIDFLKGFGVKRICFIFFLTLDQINTSKSQNLVESLETDHCNRNERFTDLISEILIGEAPFNDFMLHYDSTSHDFIDGIIRKTNAKKEMRIKANNLIMTVNSSYPATTVMVNYDKIDELLMILRLRRYTMHVVSLNNPLKFDKLHIYFLKPSDVIIFVCQKHYGNCKDAFDNGVDINALDPFFLKEYKFLAEVLLTVIIEVLDYRVRLYEICYYCGTAAGVLIQKHEFNLTTGMLYNDFDLYPKLMDIFKFKAKNFNSHTFKVGFPYHEVYFGCHNRKETETNKGDEFVVSCDEIYNLEGNMLLQAQKRLNFKVKLLSFRFVNEGDVTDKLINVTHARRADWTIGSITMTASRAMKVFFSYPVSEDPARIIYSAERGFLKDGLKIFHVFSVYIWILIVFTLIVQSTIVYIPNRKAGQSKRKKFSEITWALGFMLIEQAQQIVWKSLGGRVLVTWIMCCICISTLLKAHLTSFITNPPVDPLNKFDELVSGGFRLNLIIAKTQFISEMLNSSPDKSLKEMSHRVNYRTDICSTFKGMIGKKEILIQELIEINNELNARCREHLTSEELLSLRVTRDDIFPSIDAWAFPKKAPYTDLINNQIMLYHQHGLQKKWSETLRVPPGNHSVYFDGVSIVDRGRLRPKTIKGFGHLFLWFIGIGLSLLCFITEIALNDLRKRKERRDGIHK